MFNFNVYREVKAWKKPIHISKTYLAKSYLKLLPQIEVIAITGSVGKTLTQNAIVSVLAQKFNVISPDENLDPTFRIPQTILATKPWHQKLVLEYGVEHPGDMDHYLEIAKPKIAVVTAIAPTHIKYFKDIEGVFAEKTKLVEALDKNSYAILNADDPMVSKMANHTKAKVWWFGQKAKYSIKISHFTQNMKSAKFRLHFKGQKASVSWKAIGRHQLTAAYGAATVGLASGLTLKQIAKGLSLTKPPLHRLNAIATKHINIIDDTYNASPKAAEEAINTLSDLGKRKTKIAVLGEMKDLGNLSSEAHKSLGTKVAKSGVNILVTVGKVAQSVAKAAKQNGFKGKTISTSSTQEAIFAIQKVITKNTLILIKGSRHAHMERIVNSLLHKSTLIHCYHCGTLK